MFNFDIVETIVAFLFLLILASIVALILAVRVALRLTQLQTRVAALENALAKTAPPDQTAAFDGEAAATPDGSSSTTTPTSAPATSPEPPQVEADVAPMQPPSRPDLWSRPVADLGKRSGAQPPPAAPEQAMPRGIGLEERLGTRWVVWVGGLTLALGGLFLVRYSIEAGLLGPAARVTLGGLFALALLVCGEWLRRNEAATAIAPPPIANIPAILTAAGTVVAFATAYASYALYDLLAPASAFLLLGMVAMGTLAAALLHGPALAGLGVVGAFVTPVLVSSGQADFWSLYVYTSLVTGAAFALARMRLWRWLAVTTLVFSTLWCLFQIDIQSALTPHGFAIAAGFALAAALVVAGLLFGPPMQDATIEPVSSASLAVYLALGLILVVAQQHAEGAIYLLAALIAAAIAIAWRAPAATAAVPVAAATTGLMFLSWAVNGNPDLLVLSGGPLPGIGSDPFETAITTHLVFAALLSALFGWSGFQAQGRFANATIPAIWAASAVAAPLAVLVATYARIAHLGRSIPFAIIAVLLAAAFGYATDQLSKRAARPGQTTAAALFATGTLGALALAFTFTLDQGWLTIALALTALGAAWTSLRRPIPFLRWLAAILAGIVTARIGYEPRIVGDAVGSTPIFNWLLYGYGVPAAAFWAGSSFLRKRADDAPLRMMEAAALLFTVLLLFMQIRHLVNGGDIYRLDAGLLETALQVCSLLAMAIGLERLRLRSGSIVHNIGALVLAGLAGLATVFGLMMAEMPLFWPHRIEGLIVNPLLLAYALPALLTLALSYVSAGRRPAAYVNALAGVALVLGMTYVTLQIRRWFIGPLLNGDVTIDAEQYAYSLAWLAIGVGLLIVGLLYASRRARLASAAVIALTVLKAFFVDMSNLTGVYRALSFIGLGLVLVAIGWFYQRFLTKPRPGQAQPI